MLYLLQDGEYYKVGYSTNMETLIKRIQTYKTHNPTFKCLGCKNGTKKDEKHYHKLLNCNSKSEWVCDINKKLLENIKLEFNNDNFAEYLISKLQKIYDNVQNGLFNWKWGRDNGKEWVGFVNNQEFKKYTIKQGSNYIINEELFRKEKELIEKFDINKKM
jgi:hypothetical protein